MLKRVTLTLLLVVFTVSISSAFGRVPPVKSYSMCQGCLTVSPYTCINPTNSFDATDDRAWAWVKFGRFTESHLVIWNWYAPNGDFYTTFSYRIPSAQEEGWEWWNWYVVWAWIGIKGNDAAQMPGNWRVDTIVDGRLVVSQDFRIRSTLPPVFAPPSPRFGSQRSIFVPYTDGTALVDTTIRRADSPTAPWIRARIEVDTGAAISLFPRSMATKLGINLTSGDQLQIRDVSGDTIEAWQHWIEVALLAPDNTALPAIKIRATFAENDKVPYLLGRLDVLDQVNISFQSDGFTISLKE